ncbi:MAG: hypothetical protein D6731_22605 [Planctomycetota bacterium]|nr:MAG: hypothetical protein D6731_22605 [Planctomycetota bacterium]
MTRKLASTALGAAALAALAAAARAPSAEALGLGRAAHAAVAPAGPHERPDPNDCVGSCATASDGPAPLGAERVRALLAAFAREEPRGAGPAGEALLFHHAAVRAFLAQGGAGPLDAERAAFLRRELARDHAWIEVRVVDAEGTERLRMRPRRVPLDEKQHLHAGPDERVRLPSLEVSGTVRRVGLDHLWTRI